MPISEVFHRSLRVYRNEGVKKLIQKIPPYIYQQLWPHLPESEEHILLNEIESSRFKKLTDDLLGEYLTEYVSDNQHYEEEYISGIRDHIGSGEYVVLIGGGEGISTVVSAHQTQPEGRVDVYEGGATEVEKVRKTVQINDVEDYVSVTHAIVAADYSLRSSAEGADVIAPHSLPECDVLGIDADGAEIPILKNLDIQPEKLIVEHHEIHGSEVDIEFQPELMRNIIDSLGYTIIEEYSDKNMEGETTEIVFVAER